MGKGNDFLSIAKLALFSTINGGDGNDTFELKGSALGVDVQRGRWRRPVPARQPEFTGSVKYNGGDGVDTFELYSQQKIDFTVNRDGSLTYNFYSDCGWR